MNTQIANWKLEPLLQKIISVLRDGTQLNSLTRLKLTKLRSALAGPYSDYHEQLPALKADHVQRNEAGEFATKTTPEGEELLFKSEEDEQQYLQVANATNTITIDMPLTADDLNEFTTSALQFELLMLCCSAEISTSTQQVTPNE